MDNNEKQGHLGPHKLDGNNLNITIPKTNLKTQAGSTHNCIDYNLREIMEKDAMIIIHRVIFWFMVIAINLYFEI